MPSAPKVVSLEKEDHQRDAEFKKVMHGDSAKAKGGVAALLKKNTEAQQIAVDEYFKHFDNKTAEGETAADREARTKEYATLTRQ